MSDYFSKDVLISLAEILKIAGVQLYANIDGKITFHLPMDVFCKTFQKEDCKINRTKNIFCNQAFLHISTEYKGFTFLTQGFENEWNALYGD